MGFVFKLKILIFRKPIAEKKNDVGLKNDNEKVEYKESKVKSKEESTVKIAQPNSDTPSNSKGPNKNKGYTDEALAEAAARVDALLGTSPGTLIASK